MLSRPRVSLARVTFPHCRFNRPAFILLVFAAITFASLQSWRTAFAVNAYVDDPTISLQNDPTQPQIGPGVSQVGSNAPRSAGGGTKAGSVLFFHKFTSDAENANQINSLLTLTNTNPRDSVSVRIFFIADCSIEDRFVTLVANQSRTLLASKEVPGKTGYAIAVAVNSLGLPTQFNWLIGNVNIRDEWGHEAGYNAFAVAKRSGGALVPKAGGIASDILFNDVDYDRLPKTVAIDHLQNQDPVYNPELTTDVALFSPLSDLSGSTPHPFKLTATAYNSVDQGFTQRINVVCGINASVSQIWTSPPFNTIISADRAGWATFSANNETDALPVLGLSLTDSAEAEMHNARVMQTLERLESFSISIPVRVPETPVADAGTQNQPDATGGSLGAGDNKAGSILFFPRFSSGEQGSAQFFLTNTHPTQKVRLWVFFNGLVEPAEVKSEIISLPALQTTTIDPDELAPNQRGWVMVVAIDNRALPIRFNHLIGSAQVNETSGQTASFNAVAIAKNSEGAVSRNEDQETADLLFNDEVYDRLPATTAMTFVPSQVDNSTLLGFSRVPGSLLEPPNTRGAATATLYDSLLASFSASVPRTENNLNQLRSALTQPPITNTLQPGDHGWLKLLSTTPVISWSLNMKTSQFSASANGTWRGGFNGDGNLHILTSADSFTVKVPANNPNNHPPAAIAETIGLQVEARRPAGTIVRLNGSLSSDEDPDDPLTFEWLDGNEPISTARVADRLLGIGAHFLSLVVTDGSGVSSLPAEQTATVVDSTPPQISGVPSAVIKVTDNVNGEPINFATPIAYDMIDGMVTVTSSKAPGSIFPLGRTVVTFTARDKAGNTSTATMDVTVDFGAPQPQTGGVAGDKAPLMDNLNDLYVIAGKTQSIQLQAADPDGDSVTFSLLNAPSYAQIVNVDPGSRTATLLIAPKSGENEGKAGVRVVVNDGRGQSFTTLPFRVMISDFPNDDTGSGVGKNRAPVAVIGNLPATIQSTNKMGAEVALDASTSSDPDGDSLSFSWFDGDNLIAKGAFVKVNLAVGAHVIRLTAFDGKDGITTTAPVTLIVAPRELTASAATPNRLHRSSTETLTIIGAGFSPAAELRFGKDGITVTSYLSVEEDKIVATIAVSDKATPGFRDIYVVNPNGKNVRLRSALFVNP